MASMTDSEFWRKLPYRPRLRRRGVPAIDSTFPYQTRHRKDVVPSDCPASWQGDVESARHAVDYRQAEILGATTNVTAGSRMQSSAEQIYEQLSTDDNLEDKKGDEKLENTHQMSTEFQIPIKISVTSPDLESFILDLSETSIGDMARSWFGRRFPRLFRGFQPTDACKSTDIVRGAGQSICPCSGCYSHPSSLQSPEALLFSKPSKYGDVDSFRGKARAIDLKSWFRKHRHSWGKPSEYLPLTAEGLGQLRVRDITLEIERTQVVNELAMTQDLLRYILDTISRSQPHNQVRVNMIREYKRLKDQETGLVDHLQNIEHGMDHINELENPQNCEFGDFSHELILPIETPPIQYDARHEVSWPPSSAKCEIITPPQATIFANANLQLQLYNKEWAAAQKLMDDPTSPSIPWSTKSLEFVPNQYDKIDPGLGEPIERGARVEDRGIPILLCCFRADNSHPGEP